MVAVIAVAGAALVFSMLCIMISDSNEYGRHLSSNDVVCNITPRLIEMTFSVQKHPRITAHGLEHWLVFKGEKWYVIAKAAPRMK